MRQSYPDLPMPIYINNASGNNVIDGGEGDDRFELGSSTGNNQLSGGLGNDTILARTTQGANAISGNEG
ncbi:MAG: hypothetical protein ACRDBG_27200, partial [Waterburya sp.]